ncbi:UDPGT domain-containing protein/Glyco_transf_28 domain-containing protein [Cephalotus follicularis]|uniref:sterol 3beta-glucosyltransferase n=1 Tax=Cephalotus follicularis TaxID=3775 RepID=A0A1Q3BRU7_CEPFO|nr:UDPGT domain-containing protein/Glyco_transf_28 domain-containing protein [Cephalotus follicularis]
MTKKPLNVRSRTVELRCVAWRFSQKKDRKKNPSNECLHTLSLSLSLVFSKSNLHRFSESKHKRFSFSLQIDLDRERRQNHQVVSSPAAMAESPDNHSKSSSTSYSEVTVEIGSGSSSSVDCKASGNGGGGGSVNNGGTGSSGTGKLESTSCQPQLERSKTDRQRHPNILAEETAQIFDDKISVQQKLKLLNRIATVKDDGTVEFEVPGDVEPQVLHVGTEDVYNEVVDDEPLDATDLQYIPPLQIVMLIVGTRGDVQPFIAIGKRLQDYGHRVRLATHSNFKEFVLTAGLEFYPLGGDPKVLAGYMVKNKGFLPSGPSEIPIQRNQIKEIIYSLLPACKDPDIDSGIPFKADAIIANPPAYGHTHVAEALKIPLHIFFTMPWTPTSEFPHPLSRVKQPAGYRLSYQIVDSFIWLGIRDMINDVRKKKLKLRPVTYLSGSQGSDSDVPYGYIWSPHLVPKPKDWGPKVDVVGFCFLDLASSYEPPESLVKWLEAGPKPIYIGFGSLPVQEPEKMTQIIVEALEKTEQRGIINKGWGGLGNLAEPKDSIYLLDNCPHDWLFLRCKAVVHHGGAGTTAAGLKAACPTTIVPFFGDQPFWGERVHARGVGPQPIPIDEFSLPKLVDAINYMLDPKVKDRAVELAKAMENEDGVTGAVKAFLKHLPRKKSEPEPSPDPSSFFSFRRCFGCS